MSQPTCRTSEPGPGWARPWPHSWGSPGACGPTNLGLELGSDQAGARMQMGMREEMGLGPGNTGDCPRRLTWDREGLGGMKVRQGGVQLETREQGRWISWRGVVISLDPGAEPPSQEACQSCVPIMCSADPNLEPVTPAKTYGGGLLWKGHSPRSRYPHQSRGPLQNSPTGRPQSTVSVRYEGRWKGSFGSKIKKRLWAIVPFHCRHTTIPKAAATQLQCPRTKHLHSASSKAVPIPQEPREG